MIEDMRLAVYKAFLKADEATCHTGRGPYGKGMYLYIILARNAGQFWQAFAESLVEQGKNNDSHS